MDLLYRARRYRTTKWISKKVKAELYRVDDALTLEGERLVSDSLEIDVPEKLPIIEINKGN